MEYEKLGRTDLLISRIGFGCWAIGGHGYGEVDDKESTRAIGKALDLGINFFDTAGVYGFGHSEEILGKALGSQKNRVVIATKFGLNWNPRGATFRDCSAPRIQEALEGSLRRLGLECIPLFQVHWYDGRTPISDIMETLEKCQQAGKIRHIGCCNFGADLVSEVSKCHRIESLQCPYNVGQRDFLSDLERLSSTLEVGVIVFNVLRRGLLTGKYDMESNFGIHDTRMKDKAFQGESMRKALQLVDMLKRIGESIGKSACQVAIRFVLDNPSVTCALIGVKRPEQIVENVSVLDWGADPIDWHIIDKKWCWGDPLRKQ